MILDLPDYRFSIASGCAEVLEKRQSFRLQSEKSIFNMLGDVKVLIFSSFSVLKTR